MERGEDRTGAGTDPSPDRPASHDPGPDDAEAEAGPQPRGAERRKAERRRAARLSPERRQRRRRRSALVARLVFLCVVGLLVAGALALHGRSVPLPVWAVAEVEARMNRAIGAVLPETAVSVGGIALGFGKDWAPELDLEEIGRAHV